MKVTSARSSGIEAGPLNVGDRVLFSDIDQQWRKGVVLSTKAGRIRIRSDAGREFTKIRFEVTPDRDQA